MYQDNVVNNLYSGNIYPGDGFTMGAAASPLMAPMPVAGVEVSGNTIDPGSAEVIQASATGAQGSAAAVWIAMAVALFLLMWVAKRFGSQGKDFANIQLTVYNVLVLAFAGVIGSTMLKALFTKIKIPGLSSLVLAS